MPSRPPRSSLALAAEWVSRITTISLEMVLPGVGGVWLDGRLATGVLFTLLGFGLGIALAMWHLIKLTQASEKEDEIVSDA